MEKQNASIGPCIKQYVLLAALMAFFTELLYSVFLSSKYFYWMSLRDKITRNINVLLLGFCCVVIWNFYKANEAKGKALTQRFWEIVLFGCGVVLIHFGAIIFDVLMRIEGAYEAYGFWEILNRSSSVLSPIIGLFAFAIAIVSGIVINHKKRVFEVLAWSFGSSFIGRFIGWIHNGILHEMAVEE